jgi:hypothetical protein
VPLSGHPQVVDPVEHKLYGLTGHVGCENGQHAPRRRLILFATEASAEALHVDLDEVLSNAQHAGCSFLNGVRALGGRLNKDSVPLAGNRSSALGLEVEVLLSSDV